MVAMASSQRFAWRRDDGRVPDIQSNAARGGVDFTWTVYGFRMDVAREIGKLIDFF